MTEAAFGLIAFILIFVAIQGARGKTRLVDLWPLAIPISALVLLGLFQVLFSGSFSNAEKLTFLAGVGAVGFASSRLYLEGKGELLSNASFAIGMILVLMSLKHFEVNRILESVPFLLSLVVVLFFSDKIKDLWNRLRHKSSH